MDPTSFLDDATANEIKALARRGFATVLQMSDPPRENLEIWRQTPSGEYALAIVGDFSVKEDRNQAGRGGDEGFQRTSITGTIRRFIPEGGGERLRQGDRFTLPEHDFPLIITALAPDRFGVESARWEMEEGAA